MLSLTSPFRTLLIYLGVHPWHSSLSPSLLAPLSSAHRQGTIGSPFIYFSVHGWFSCHPSLSLGPSCSLSLAPPPNFYHTPLPSREPSGHRLFISAFLDGSCSPSLSLGPSCSLSLAPPPNFYHTPLPSRDHRVTVYLFQRSWTAFALSLPIHIPHTSLARSPGCSPFPHSLAHLPPRDHLAPSLPIPRTLLLALLIPALSHPFPIKGSSGHRLFIQRS